MISGKECRLTFLHQRLTFDGASITICHVTGHTAKSDTLLIKTSNYYTQEVKFQDFLLGPIHQPYGKNCVDAHIYLLVSSGWVWQLHVVFAGLSEAVPAQGSLPPHRQPVTKPECLGWTESRAEKSCCTGEGRKDATRGKRTVIQTRSLTKMLRHSTQVTGLHHIQYRTLVARSKILSCHRPLLAILGWFCSSRGDPIIYNQTLIWQLYNPGTGPGFVQIV